MPNETFMRDLVSLVSQGSEAHQIELFIQIAQENIKVSNLLEIIGAASRDKSSSLSSGITLTLQSLLAQLWSSLDLRWQIRQWSPDWQRKWPDSIQPIINGFEQRDILEQIESDTLKRCERQIESIPQSHSQKTEALGCN